MKLLNPEGLCFSLDEPRFNSLPLMAQGRQSISSRGVGRTDHL